jgi:hypothetical protein
MRQYLLKYGFVIFGSVENSILSIWDGDRTTAFIFLASDFMGA